MTDIFQGDPAIKLTKNGATLVYIGGQPVMDAGLENQALISLFTEKGWPGNYLFDDPAQQIGSDFEKLARGPITLSKLDRIEKTAEAALKADIFGTVRVTASNPESWQTDVSILIEPPGGRAFTINLVSNGQNKQKTRILPILRARLTRQRQRMTRRLTRFCLRLKPYYSPAYISSVGTGSDRFLPLPPIAQG
jgi:phage gp46-like protein